MYAYLEYKIKTRNPVINHERYHYQTVFVTHSCHSIVPATRILTGQAVSRLQSSAL